MDNRGLAVLCRASAEEFERLARLYRARAEFLEASGEIRDNVVALARPAPEPAER